MSTEITIKSKSTNKSSSAIKTKELLLKLLKPSKSKSEKENAYRFNELRILFNKLQSTNELKLVETIEKDNDDDDDTTALGSTEIQKKWNTWLKKKYIEFMRQLFQDINNGKKYALRTFFGVLATINTATSSTSLYEKYMLSLVKAICMHNEEEKEIIDDSFLKMLQLEFLGIYRDVQYYTLLSVRKLSDSLIHNKDKEYTERVANTCIRLLMLIDVVKTKDELEDGRFLVASTTLGNIPVQQSEEGENGADSQFEDDYDSESSSSSDDEEESDEKKDTKTKDSSKKRVFVPPQTCIKRHRSALANAYLSTLRLPLSNQTHKVILAALPTSIIPNMAHPIRLSDYLTQSYSIGGLSSILSLEGLFILMTKYNLEYPQFYNSLYTLMNTSIFYSAHRTKFLQLLSFVLLKSQMLPAYLIAAFCKRLARIALTSPPSGIFFILALISNLLRKHNACLCLINRSTNNSSSDQISDPFDAETNDASQTKALQSSLWELAALEKHYHPDVVTLAKSIGLEDDKNFPFYDMDMFLNISYDSLKEKEGLNEKKVNKRKSSAPLTFSRPSKLIPKGDVWDKIFDISC